jgi:hypothetical protein
MEVSVGIIELLAAPMFAASSVAILPVSFIFVAEEVNPAHPRFLHGDFQRNSATRDSFPWYLLADSVENPRPALSFPPPFRCWH